MLIVFDLYAPVETAWELGLPFIKKEKLFFDMDKEHLGICLDDEKQTKNNSTYVLINVALISFLCALVVGLLFMMPSKKERKKRANELVEDYEYTKA
jgi:hypothetical protein